MLEQVFNTDFQGLVERVTQVHGDVFLEVVQQWAAPKVRGSGVQERFGIRANLAERVPIIDAQDRGFAEA